MAKILWEIACDLRVSRRKVYKCHSPCAESPGKFENHPLVGNTKRMRISWALIFCWHSGLWLTSSFKLLLIGCCPMFLLFDDLHFYFIISVAKSEQYQLELLELCDVGTEIWHSMKFWNCVMFLLTEYLLSGFVAPATWWLMAAFLHLSCRVSASPQYGGLCQTVGRGARCVLSLAQPPGLSGRTAP